MHISEGVLPVSILAAGAVVAAGGLVVGLKKTENDRVPQTALLASAFFVASLVHVPVGPSSVHLILNGLLGVLLGWSAFPAIFIALTLQAVLFQFGGLTVLGVNTAVMALPAVVLAWACHPLLKSSRPWARGVGAFLTGSGAVAGSGLLLALSLRLAGEAFSATAMAVLAAHLPVMVIEGVITVAVVSFLVKVRPEMLEAAHV